MEENGRSAGSGSPGTDAGGAREPPAASTSPFGGRAHDLLRNTFGFEAFRDGQERALAAVEGGRDCLVVMPTGSGKSLCYQVPALVLPGVTLVVSPLIALMKDQVDALGLRGVPVTCINSSIPLDEQWERLDAMRQGVFKLVYVAPERFRNRGFRRALADVDVSLLAIDEAHCISQWGHDFRPDYRRLREVRALLSDVPAIALTATATVEVREDIVRELDMDDPVSVVTGFDRPNLAYHVTKTSSDAQKQARLVELVTRQFALREGGEPPAGIIYTGTRRQTEEVAGFLSDLALPGTDDIDGPWCRPYHAGLDADVRREVQEDFMEGRLPCVAATNAFGMGVDKADIRFVAHYALPGSIEAYYQEVGRAGRDGDPARCELLFSEGDRRLQEFFIEGANPSRQLIEAVHHFLWTIGENPIFRSLNDLEEVMSALELLPEKLNPMAFRSALSILERAGALERLDHYDNLAEIAPAPESDWLANPYPRRAPVKHAVFESLREVFARAEGDAASFHLEGWAAQLGLSIESLRQGLAHLSRDGLVRYTPPFRGRAIRLPETRQALAEIGVDFAALHARRLRDEQRLQQMLSLARARECRRNRILRHFGEEIPSATCGTCDQCLAHEGSVTRHVTPRELTANETVIVRKILAGVARAKGRCGRGRIVQMLVGSSAQPVTELGFQHLSTWGILRGMPRTTIRELMDKLEEEGCLRQVGDRFPILRLTDRGRRVMLEEEAVRLSLPEPARVAPSRSDASRCDSSNAADSADDGAWDEELFQRLRHLRRGIADELGVPAFRVFGDRSLRAMAREKPCEPDSFRRIPGVGERTFERFGDAFLTEIVRSVATES